MKRLVVAGAVLVLLVTSAGCKFLKKKAGGKCTGEEATCLDKANILECHDGMLLQMACKGPKGCAERHTGTTVAGRNTTHNYAVECDFSESVAGEACLDDTAMCSADKARMVACKDKKILVAKCLGPKKCSETATKVDCDTSVQPVGETCEAEEAACSPDGKQMLHCVSGKLAVAQNCRGPKGCSVSGDHKIDCDAGPQSVGDACSGDGYECSGDKKTLLKCAKDKWSVDQKCKKTCVTQGREVGCQ
jgi:hypothetical protein